MNLDGTVRNLILGIEMLTEEKANVSNIGKETNQKCQCSIAEYCQNN